MWLDRRARLVTSLTTTLIVVGVAQRVRYLLPSHIVAATRPDLGCIGPGSPSIGGILGPSGYIQRASGMASDLIKTAI